MINLLAAPFKLPEPIDTILETGDAGTLNSVTHYGHSRKLAVWKLPVLRILYLQHLELAGARHKVVLRREAGLGVTQQAVVGEASGRAVCLALGPSGPSCRSFSSLRFLDDEADTSLSPASVNLRNSGPVYG